MKHILLSLVLLVGLSEVSYSQDKKNKWLENLKKVKYKVLDYVNIVVNIVVMCFVFRFVNRFMNLCAKVFVNIYCSHHSLGGFSF